MFNTVIALICSLWELLWARTSQTLWSVINKRPLYVWMASELGSQWFLFNRPFMVIIYNKYISNHRSLIGKISFMIKHFLPFLRRSNPLYCSRFASRISAATVEAWNLNKGERSEPRQGWGQHKFGSLCTEVLKGPHAHTAPPEYTNRPAVAVKLNGTAQSCFREATSLPCFEG